MSDYITFGDRRFTLEEICAEKGIKPGKGVTARIVMNRMVRGKGLTEAITQNKGAGARRPFEYGNR